MVDGTIWIKNWIEGEYPYATDILDFYHANEHVSNFAGFIIKDIELKILS